MSTDSFCTDSWYKQIDVSRQRSTGLRQQFIAGRVRRSCWSSVPVCEFYRGRPDLSARVFAIIDRLLHYSTTVNIRGESYRLKDKKRAGIF